MKLLTTAFENSINSELIEKYATNNLPPEFAAEFARFKTAHVITDPALFTDTPIPEKAKLEREQVVLAFKRPSLLIKKDGIESCASEEWTKILDDFRPIINSAAKGVGRIDLRNHDTLSWVGTGFLVDGNRVVTNRHVAQEFVQQHGAGFQWKVNSTGKNIRGCVDFLEQYLNPEENEFEIEDILYLADDDEADIAILKLKSAPEIERLDLSFDLVKDRMIITIGYPWKDSRVSGKLEGIHKRIFNDIYDVKRAAPGKVIELLGNEFSHDCSTLGGNSGSACIDIESGKVLGIHYGGQYVQNLAVSARSIADVL